MARADVAATGETPNRIRSRDGTPIAYLTTGAGPGVIVIPGVLTTAKDYARLAAALGRTLTVHILERRGRGQSGPQGDLYSIKLELDDVAAVQEATGARLLLGHSFGGLIALESALALGAFERVAVYEPGVSVAGSISTARWADAYRRALKQGRPLDAFAQFSVASGPVAARSLPVWAMRMLLPRVLPRRALEEKFSLLDQNLREHEVIDRLADTFPAYGAITAEVLLMVGGKSNLPWLPAAVKALTQTLPRLTVHRFPKLDHFGPESSGPQIVADRVARFFHAAPDAPAR